MRYVLTREQSAIMDTADLEVTGLILHGTFSVKSLEMRGIEPPLPPDAVRVDIGARLEKPPQEGCWMVDPAGTARWTHGGLCVVRAAD